MGLLFLLILISSFGLVGFESIYSLYVNEVFGFTMGNIALVLTLNGLTSLTFQALLFDRLVVWLTEKTADSILFLAVISRNRMGDHGPFQVGSDYRHTDYIYGLRSYQASTDNFADKSQYNQAGPDQWRQHVINQCWKHCRSNRIWRVAGCQLPFAIFGCDCLPVYFMVDDVLDSRSFFS